MTLGPWGDGAAVWCIGVARCRGGGKAWVFVLLQQVSTYLSTLYHSASSIVVIVEIALFTVPLRFPFQSP